MPTHDSKRRIATRLRCAALIVTAAVTSTFAVSTVSAANRVSFPPVDRSESRAAYEELIQARRALVRARISRGQSIRISTTAARISRGAGDGGYEPLPGSPRDETTRYLEQNAAEASARFYAARRPLIATVQSEQSYKELTADREAARKTIRDLVDAGKVTETDLFALAGRALEASRRMTRAEVIAFALDANIENARLAMTEAYAALREQSEAARANPHPVARPVRATEADLAAARQRIDDANRRLADALMREAALEQYRTMRIENFRAGPPTQLFNR